jgi:hypothetical protein
MTMDAASGRWIEFSFLSLTYDSVWMPAITLFVFRGQLVGDWYPGAEPAVWLCCTTGIYSAKNESTDTRYALDQYRSLRSGVPWPWI